MYPLMALSLAMYWVGRSPPSLKSKYPPAIMRRGWCWRGGRGAEYELSARAGSELKTRPTKGGEPYVTKEPSPAPLSPIIDLHI